MLPCGTYNTTYEKDIAIVRTKTQWGLLIGFVVFLFSIPPLYFSDHWLSFMISCCVAVVAVLGLNILTGLCGQISLGQAAFVGVGAYTTAILTARFGWSYWATIPCAALSAGVIGLIFGIPSLRVKGFYLAIATLAAQYFIIWLIGHPLTPLTGGLEGMAMPRPHMGAIVLNTDKRTITMD